MVLRASMGADDQRGPPATRPPESAKTATDRYGFAPDLATSASELSIE
jgi:hypothetical protein